MTRFQRFIPILFLLIGLTLAFYPMIFSGFERVPGDLGDSRLQNYLLEHSWRWMLRYELHQDFWSPPIFYPQSNAGAYTDVVLTALPCYAPWRLVGFDPLTAFQLCFLCVAALNYLCMFALLRRLSYSSMSSSIGAFLFAFASPRLWHTFHFQLHVHFYTIIAIYALVTLWKQSSTHAHRWIAIFCLSFAAQWYCSFYLGWFLGLTLLIALGWALCFRMARQGIYQLIKKHFWKWCLWGSIALFAVFDLGRHYLQAVQEVGYQDEELLFWGIPYPSFWLAKGDSSWLAIDNVLLQTGMIDIKHWPRGEQGIGLGLLTSVIILIGIYRLRHKPGFAIFLLTGLTWLVITTYWTFDFSLWKILYPVIPGAAAIRALCRIVLIALIPASIGLASFFERQRQWGWTLFFGLMVIAEQGQNIGSFQKSEHETRIAPIVKEVRKTKQPFYFQVRVTPSDHPKDVYLQLDAMWASLITETPTVNGYAGRWSAKWHPLLKNWHFNDKDERRLRRALDAWLKSLGVSLEKVSWTNLKSRSLESSRDTP